MKTRVPRVIFGLSCLAVGLAVFNGLFWFLTVVVDHDGRGALGFRNLFFPGLGGAFLLLGILSGAFYLWTRERRDFASFIMSSGSLLTILGESIAQSYVPLHGPW